MSFTPDATDLAILRLLSRDATLGAAEVGRALNMTQPATWRRIKRLQDEGVIAGQRVVLDNAAVGFGVTVFLGIRLATKGRTSISSFAMLQKHESNNRHGDNDMRDHNKDFD